MPLAVPAGKSEPPMLTARAAASACGFSLMQEWLYEMGGAEGEG